RSSSFPWSLTSRRRAAARRSRAGEKRTGRCGRRRCPTDRCQAGRAAPKALHRVDLFSCTSREPDRARAAPGGTSISAGLCRWNSSYRALDEELLDLVDGARRIQVLGARVDAIHDGVAAEQAVRILEVVEALGARLVAGVREEPIGLQQPGRADELVGVPPERRARGRAAGAQDALVEAVELLALLRRLQPLALGRRIVVDHVGLDRVVLLEELRH